jgi:putative ABC transport system ATP-binding protein
MLADGTLTPVVRTEQAERTYGTGPEAVAALSAVNLDFMPGEFTVLRGRSGSGKSTLLNLVGLLDRPTGGRIVLRGQETERLNGRKLALLRRKSLGFVLQDSGVIERMTAMMNVALPGYYAGLSMARSRKLAAIALDKVDLADKAGRLVGQLSGGERMRVGVARALLLSPHLVICDEPTASLDADTSRLVVRRLRTAVQDGACIICASHDPLVIERADRLITLAGGEIVEDQRQAAEFAR